MADNRKFPSVLAKRLKTDISATDTTFKLPDIKWYTGSDGVDVNLAASDFGTVAYGVFEPNTARQEFFTWDPTTIANYATTGISISARGLPWSSDYTTESSTRKFGHDSGTKVLLMTNAPAFYDQFTNKNNDETIVGLWTFPTGANYPLVGASYSAPTDDKHVATKKYVDDVALAGAPDATTTVKGVVELATVAEQGSATATGGTGANLVLANANLVKTSSGASDENKVAVLDASGTFANGFIDKARTWSTVQSFTANNAQITTDADSANDAVRSSYLDTVVPKGAVSGTSGEAITAGQGVYLKASDGKLWKTVGNADESTFSFVGVALTTVAAADLAVTYAPPGHTVTGLSSLTAGSYYFITDTAGTLGTTPGTRFARVGIAISTTALLVTLPKYRATGTFTVSATGNTVVTTGFYPGSVRLRAGTNDAPGTNSVGDDSNRCVHTSCGNINIVTSINASAAVHLRSDVTTYQTGTISAKSATGFTYNCSINSGSNNVIQWDAESL